MYFKPHPIITASTTTLLYLHYILSFYPLLLHHILLFSFFFPRYITMLSFSLFVIAFILSTKLTLLFSRLLATRILYVMHNLLLFSCNVHSFYFHSHFISFHWLISPFLFFSSKLNCYFRPSYCSCFSSFTDSTIIMTCVTFCFTFSYFYFER